MLVILHFVLADAFRSRQVPGGFIELHLGHVSICEIMRRCRATYLLIGVLLLHGLFLARPMMHAFGANSRIVAVDVNTTPCYVPLVYNRLSLTMPHGLSYLLEISSTIFIHFGRCSS